MKHTPGPWWAYKGDIVTNIRGVPRPIAGLSCGYDFEVSYGDRPGAALADVKLMAAAPDLLDALKDLVGALDGSKYHGVTYAKELIAKLEGGDE